MFESVGWGEILVLIVAGLFILGPERLPAAAAWLGKTIRQVKDYAGGAREQLRGEFGSEFETLRKPLEELRGLRDFNPRNAAKRAFWDDPDPEPKPNGFAPGPAEAGTTPNLTKSNGSTPERHPATGPAPATLRQNEAPPIDPDAT